MQAIIREASYIADRVNFLDESYRAPRIRVEGGKCFQRCVGRSADVRRQICGSIFWFPLLRWLVTEVRKSFSSRDQMARTLILESILETRVRFELLAFSSCNSRHLGMRVDVFEERFLGLSCGLSRERWQLCVRRGGILWPWHPLRSRLGSHLPPSFVLLSFRFQPA